MIRRLGALFGVGLLLLSSLGGCVRTEAGSSCTCNCDGSPMDSPRLDTAPGDGPLVDAGDGMSPDQTQLDLGQDLAPDLAPDLPVVNHYLRFDTSKERVHSDQLMSWDSDFTVSLRIRLLAAPSNYTDFITCFNYDAASDTLSGWEIGFKDSAKPRWFIVNHDKDPWGKKCEKTSGQSMQVGTWYRVTFVFDYTSPTAAVPKMFVDGQLWIDSNSAGSSPAACIATMAPGPFEPNTFRLGGMDQVKLDADDLWVFNRVLTSTEIAALGSTIPTGLVLRWDMNEGTGTTLNDGSGNNLTGTISNPDWHVY